MSDRRRILGWAVTSTRLIVGAAVAALLVVGVVVAALAPWPGRATPAVAVAAKPAAADTVLACAGPVLALGRDAADATALAFATAQDVVSAAGSPLKPGTLTPIPVVPGAPAPQTFTAAPENDAPADAAAAGSAQLDTDDLRGFAASACRPALTESWLVGGATTTGSADLLVLANPGTVPASVDLTAYTANGPETPAGGRGLVVAAGSQRILPLAGLVLGSNSPIVRVTASGAPVVASLQSSITRTLLPGGVDQTSAIAAASPRVVIPGVTVTPEAQAVSGAGATSIARILSPQTDTSATVTVSGADGAAVSSNQYALTAGLPIEVELGTLPAGTYTVTVSAAVGVVASVWETTGFGQGADFAWYATAPALTSGTLVAVPEGPSPTLALAADQATDVRIEPLTGGAAQTVSIRAGAGANVPVTGGVVYRITPSSPVHAQVSYAGAGALAAIPVWPAESAASVLTVYP